MKKIMAMGIGMLLILSVLPIGLAKESEEETRYIDEDGNEVRTRTRADGTEEIEVKGPDGKFRMKKNAERQELKIRTATERIELKERITTLREGYKQRLEDRKEAYRKYVENSKKKLEELKEKREACTEDDTCRDVTEEERLTHIREMLEKHLERVLEHLEDIESRLQSSDWEDADKTLTWIESAREEAKSQLERVQVAETKDELKQVLKDLKELVAKMKEAFKEHQKGYRTSQVNEIKERAMDSEHGLRALADCLDVDISFWNDFQSVVEKVREAEDRESREISVERLREVHSLVTQKINAIRAENPELFEECKEKLVGTEPETRYEDTSGEDEVEMEDEEESEDHDDDSDEDESQDGDVE